MKIWTFFVIMVCILLVVEIVKGEEKGKMNQEISLPSEAAGWQWDEKEMKYNSRTLFDYIDGTAELYLAYGFQSLTVRRFEKSKQPPITVELYEMASSEDAYGVFSFERQDEAVGIGQGSEFGGGLLRFWKGNCFVSIYADGEGMEVESAILTMGRAAANSIQATGPAPKLVTFIPGKDPGNAYQSFMKAYLPDTGGKDHSRTEDRKWTFARQRNEFVLIVFGAPTEANAQG